MNLSRQHSPYSLPTPDAPMHQRSTLIELLVVISIIGILICDKQ
jgi:prepilin-type N-terminal cleavage/methylation domain-containing protein